MDPQTHEGRTGSPFNDWLEGSGVVDDVDVLDAPPVAASAVAGVVHLPPLRRDANPWFWVAVLWGLTAAGMLAVAGMVALGGN